MVRPRQSVVLSVARISERESASIAGVGSGNPASMRARASRWRTSSWRPGVGMPAQLFDLEADPYERRNLAEEPGYHGLVADCETALRKLVDPEAVDALARKDQAAKSAELGGREAILAKGSFGYSPVPGTRPIYN